VRRDGAELVVLVSFARPGAETNPYLVQLAAALPAPVRPVYFSWRQALTGRFDVFHLHWPEVRLRGRTPARSVARGVLFLLLLLRLRLGRKALVRTLHNVRPHEPLTPLQDRVLRWCDRWTTLWITLTDQTRPPTPAPAVLIPHGHYRDWYRPAALDPVRGRLLHFGLVRRYKGVDRLLGAFAQLDDPELTLRIVGKLADGDLAAEVRRAAAADRRIATVDAYVSDDELAAEIARAELVVLPFTQVTNSGSLLLALSLDRPVLVPSAPVTDQLADEVGPGWVLTYPGALDAAVLRSALAEVRAGGRSDRPALGGREWDEIGRAHAAAFLAARDLARRPAHLPRTPSPPRLRRREREGR
jgi:beta-1,4-mannosyltransferase